MIASRILSMRKLFSPSHHLWIRPSHQVKNGTAVVVQMGMTEHGFQCIGDVTAAAASHLRETNNQVLVRGGENLLTLYWEGYKQTAADELYHTVWESVEGETSIVAPISGELYSVLEAPTIKEELDECTVLAELVCSVEELKRASQDLVDEAKYNEMLKKAVPGKFSENASH